MSTSAGLAEDTSRPDASSHRLRLRKRSDWGEAPNRIAALVLFFVIAAAPFPFGSTNNPSIAFWCGVLGIGLVFASPRQINRLQAGMLGVIALIVICFAFVLQEQLSSTPWIPSGDPIWSKASEVLGQPLGSSVSIVRGQPFYALGAPLACVLALVLGLIVGSEEQHARRGFHFFAWAGACYAVYGIASLLFDPNVLLWREKTAYIGNLTATFINRNTAAAYLGSASVVWLLLLLQRVRGRLPRGDIVWRKVPEYIMTDTPKDLLIRFVVFFVCLAALFLTSSRAGVTVSLFVMVAAFVAFFRRDLPRGKGLLLAIAGAGLVALTALQVLGSNVGYRFDVQGLADAGRMEAYRSMLRMIWDRPWFGFGLGTFSWAFPAYRSGDISMLGVWDIGHDTPLEFAVEMGVPLAVLVAAGWAGALVVLGRGAVAGSRLAIGPLAALAVALIAILHSLIDFSLQIPGYAIVVFGLLGLGLAEAARISSGGPARGRARTTE